MMGLISRVATSSQVGTKLKSLANLARLLTEADLVTCGQVGHKYKMVFKLITIFMEVERIILFNLNELTCDQVDHKLKWSNFRTTCPEVNCGQVGHNFRWFIYSQLLAIMAGSKIVSKLDTIFK